jgi:hypothetical protein
MFSHRTTAGARALRVLPLASVLILAACGGGGGGSAPATGPTAAGVEITAANQQQVAGDAANNAQILNVGTFIINSLVPPTVNVIGLRQGPVQARIAVVPAGANGNAAMLAAVIRKFASTARASQVAPGVAVNETVNCSNGSGTITGDEVEGAADSYTFSGTVTLNNCETTVDGFLGPVTMNGSLSINESESESEAGSSYTLSLVANQYSLQGDGRSLVLDGDLRVAYSNNQAGSTGSTSGSRLKVSEAFPLAPAADIESQVITLYNFNQTYEWTSADNLGRSEMTMQVETNAFGPTASYQVSTVEVLQTEMGNVTAGRVKIVGARNTSTLITVTSTNTVKLEVDADGNGTIDTELVDQNAWSYLPGLSSMSN